MAERAISRHSSWLVPVAVGWLLLSAAGLKVLYPPSVARESSSLSALVLSIALVDFELLIGLWLWSRLWSGTCRLVALALFGALVLFNCAQIRAGATSCCCLGRTPLSPWATLCLDVLVVGALCHWRPTNTNIRSGLRATLFAMAFLLAALPATWVVGRSVHTEFPLVAAPRMLDLGTIGQGQKATGRIVLHNRSAEAVMIDHVETSCPCLRVILPVNMVPPGNEVPAEIVVDLGLEPRYSGSLAIQVHGFTPAGRNVGGFSVLVRVTES